MYLQNKSQNTIQKYQLRAISNPALNFWKFDLSKNIWTLALVWIFRLNWWKNKVKVIKEQYTFEYFTGLREFYVYSKWWIGNLTLDKRSLSNANIITITVHLLLLDLSIKFKVVDCHAYFKRAFSTHLECYARQGKSPSYHLWYES